MARRKVKNFEKRFVPYFSARLDFPSPPLSAPGSPRMKKSKNVYLSKQGQPQPRIQAQDCITVNMVNCSIHVHRVTKLY